MRGFQLLNGQWLGLARLSNLINRSAAEKHLTGQ
jgi:hypothetical protein